MYSEVAYITLCSFVTVTGQYLLGILVTCYPYLAWPTNWYEMMMKCQPKVTILKPTSIGNVTCIALRGAPFNMGTLASYRFFVFEGMFASFNLNPPWQISPFHKKQTPHVSVAKIS